jgi:hypothetical protein
MKSYYDYKIQDWIKEINLDSYRQRPFVVVDPVDPSGLLYLSHHEYQRLVTTALANQTNLVVVARPGQASYIESVQAGLNAQSNETINPSVSDEALQKNQKEYASDFNTSPTTPSPKPTQVATEEGKDSKESSPPPVIKSNKLSNSKSNNSTPPKGVASPAKSVPEDSLFPSLFNARGLAHLGQDPFLTKDQGSSLSELNLEQLFRKLKRFWMKGSSQSDLRWYTVTKLENGEDRFTSMVTLTDRNVRLVYRNWTRSVLFWTGESRTSQMDQSILALGKSIKHSFQHHGALATIKFLKISLFVVNGYLGGNPNVRPWELKVPMTLTNGLPAWLPLAVRRALRARSIPAIRVWVSVLNSFKGIYAEHKAPNLSTITSEHPSYWELYPSLEEFADSFWQDLRKVGARPLAYPKSAPLNAWRALTKSSPQGISSTIAADYSAAVWWLSGNKSLERFFREVGATWLYDAFFDSASREIAVNGRVKFLDRRNPMNHLGRLSTKKEPAGKVRVFAMVDYWTQKALGPIHDWMFSVLKRISSDATFDQDGALVSYVKEVPKGHYCYDLTSATDNIPQSLYRILMNTMMGSRISDAWMNLLVDRTFVVPGVVRAGYKYRGKDLVLPTYGELAEIILNKLDRLGASLNDMAFFPEGKYKKEDVLPYPFEWPIPEGMTLDDMSFTVRYTRGQPMGALSSWASLALVHHFVVYMALKRASRYLSPEEFNENLFKNYRILGDDIVIGNRFVAEHYLRLCEELGIPINQHKSEVSPVTDNPKSGGLVVFANQVKLFGTDISPASLREDLAISTYFGRFEQVRRMLRRGWFTNVSKLPGLSVSGGAAPSHWSISGILRGLLYPDQWNRVKGMLFAGLLSLELRTLLMALLLPRSEDRGYNSQAVEAIIILSNKSNPLAKIQDLVEGGLPLVPTSDHIKFLQYQYKFYLINYIELRARVAAYRWDVLDYLEHQLGWDPDNVDQDPALSPNMTVRAYVAEHKLCARALNAKLPSSESSLLLARELTANDNVHTIISALQQAVDLLKGLITDLPPVSDLSNLLGENRYDDENVDPKTFANVMDKALLSNWWAYVAKRKAEPMARPTFFEKGVLPIGQNGLRYAEVFHGDLSWYNPYEKIPYKGHLHQTPPPNWGPTPVDVLTYLPYVLDIILVPGDLFSYGKVPGFGSTVIRFCFMTEIERESYYTNLRDHQWYGYQYQENCAQQSAHQLFLYQSNTRTEPSHTEYA